MTPPFGQLMLKATQLMRSGRLHEATTMIQSAFGTPTGAGARGAPVNAPAAHRASQASQADVIDVEARPVAQAPGAAAGADRQARGWDGWQARAPAGAPMGARPGAPAAAPAGAQPAAQPGEQVDGRAARQGADAAPPGPSTARPGQPAATPRFLCGTFSNALGARDYKLFEPARTDGRPLPLLVMLHGCKQDPDDFARGTGMNELAQAQGLLVLYPAQSQRANPSRCWNWFKHNHQARDRGEPGLLAAMVREIVATHAVDAQRIYVAGLSAGGAMAAILGDAYPELFAAVGVHSGLATGSATDVPSAFEAMKHGARAQRRTPRTGAAPPTIVFHGDADQTVHLANGQRVIEAAQPGRAAPGRRARSAGGREATCQVYHDEQGAERAEHWTVHGAGHAWSGGRPGGSYTDAGGPDASAEMLRFFLAHPLPDGR